MSKNDIDDATVQPVDDGGTVGDGQQSTGEGQRPTGDGAPQFDTNVSYRERRSTPSVVEVRDLNVYYGDEQALENVEMTIPRQQVTAMIGPSGCGKSTFLRCLNRMNDLVEAARIEGEVLLEGTNLYGDDVDPVVLRRRIGMVFQQPNPFPKSIYDNVAFGLRVQNKTVTDEIIERALKRAALWDEVKDKLHRSALDLSGGQQQRLCIARAIAVDPDVILMDEPASALDPVATSKIEDLIEALAEDYTVVIVTHNMQQAARISDKTAVFLTGGELVEFDDTNKIFENPEHDRVEDYISGKFG
ncbi:phosphate ABC transporter, ATP-binding protein [Halovivax ruber XH-70]|uniref:Phosphate ABC transporter, ATP-binding protein n=1 Tax=Halovivax ruber (strain DSM 18193 / JCM 13892 / XH-70) TaxID=797302 RepID=L0I701_HALRX|nr:phosphate ABC transporter ATP-binding protein PstB [Halovivax ruber]AGB15310.1 phosphate ABC transporter, ATP-binding protein [Halovivax ruber XH-70]